MKRLNLCIYSVALIMPFMVYAADNQSQEEYDRQVSESIQAMTVELQNMSGEMVKFINAFNKALNESMPQLSQNMGNVIKSMKPLANTMQKSVDDFAREVDIQVNEMQADNQASIETITQPADDLTPAIDAELKNFNQVPQKIKLFSSTVE